MWNMRDGRRDLINRSRRPLLLLAGETRRGGTRIGHCKDRIVPAARTSLPLDVFCVEHGRWTGQRAIRRRDTIVPHVRESAAVDQVQTKVWESVRNGTNVAPPPAAPARENRPAQYSRRDRRQWPARKHTRKSSSRAAVGVSIDDFVDEVQRPVHSATVGLKGERVVGVWWLTG